MERGSLIKVFATLQINMEFVDGFSMGDDRFQQTHAIQHELAQRLQQNPSTYGAKEWRPFEECDVMSLFR
jgi:hypothetical protein